MNVQGHYHNHDKSIDFYSHMSFAYAIKITINWGNEACILTFTTTFGPSHIVMMLHKVDWLESELGDIQNVCFFLFHILL